MENCEIGLIPAIGFLGVLCYDNELDHEARIQTFPIYKFLIKILQKLKPNIKRGNYQTNGLLKVSLVLLKALVSERNNKEILQN